MLNKSYAIRYRGIQDAVSAVRKALIRVANNDDAEECGWEYIQSIGRLEKRDFTLISVEEVFNGR